MSKIIDLLSKVRKEGVYADTSKLQQGSKAYRVAMLTLILHLVSNGLRVIELSKSGRGIDGMVLLGSPEQEAKWDNYFFDKYGDDDNVKWISKTYGSKPDELDEIFSKLGLTDVYKSYKNAWSFSHVHGNKEDEENRKKAESLLKVLLPVTDERGQLLLAEDALGNTVWGYVKRQNESGSYSFGISRRSADGQVSKSVHVSPAAVNGLTMKIQNTILSYEGAFSAQNAIQATNRLWLWNLSRNFKMLDTLDDFNPSDINDILKCWIEDNVGMKIKVGETTTEPVFIHQFPGEIKIGIWVNDLPIVFELLDVEMRVKDWIVEALKEEWLVPIKGNCKKDGTFSIRSGYNPSQRAREEYERKQKNERIYLFNLSKEEAEAIWKKYDERKLKDKHDEIKTLEEEDKKTC